MSAALSEGGNFLCVTGFSSTFQGAFTLKLSYDPKDSASTYI
ncbi:hypothetical protein NHE_0567 [Neorickettsia helminthoeca str. Oregon]|uniref:Uncharacterized protein n=1 Tax=Neorickettsia helminthoeca str. Oregon TaxID=1286528 RepID=X5HM56_9RICK|nr:hypothetical protein NHE_0567 [Neorickettsia helminthoeca str. Oregon]